MRCELNGVVKDSAKTTVFDIIHGCINTNGVNLYSIDDSSDYILVIKNPVDTHKIFFRVKGTLEEDIMKECCSGNDIKTRYGKYRKCIKIDVNAVLQISKK